MAAKVPRVIASASELHEMLAVRYAAPAYALFSEVGNSTGFATRRHADAVAMSIWPSRGLEVLGFECKSSRSDWKRELEQPEKAESVFRFCDRWWVVAGADNIVHDGELPATWGLLEAKGGKLFCKVEAPRLEPVPLSRGFVASIMRRAHASLDAVTTKAHAAGFERGVATGPNEHTAQVTRLEADKKHLQSAIATFERESGVRIDSWSHGNIGRAVKVVLKAYYFDQTGPAVSQLRAAAKRLHEVVEQEIAFYDDIQKKLPKREDLLPRPLPEPPAANGSE